MAYPLFWTDSKTSAFSLPLANCYDPFPADANNRSPDLRRSNVKQDRAGWRGSRGRSWRLAFPANGPQFGFQLLGAADVVEGDDHPVDHVVQGPVGHDLDLEPAAVAGGDFAIRENQGPQHLAGIAEQGRVVEVGDDIGQGTAEIARNQLENPRRLRREAPDMQRTVEEDGGDVGAVEQVLHVVVG